MPEWPGGARGALCLSFDNLGEAAQIELGALAPDDPSIGEHPTATKALPSLLEALSERDLAATFFVEGLNAELYPDALRAIAAGGHEVAYHAWRHEQWGELTAAAQAENLRRGVDAFEALGLSPAGLRPPGGQLGPGGIEVVRETGLRYCSPAGEGASVQDGVALLPFQWRHVDATCVLPPLGPVREQMVNSADPIDPGAFLSYLEAETKRLSSEGGFATLVLHLPMLDWWGEERIGTLLRHLSEVSRRGDVWLATCTEIAEHVSRNPGAFDNETALDPTGWGG
ncbi:MAG: polysaccharide deacetylase family protein [Solirubrobacterales bacterium]